MHLAHALQRAGWSSEEDRPKEGEEEGGCQTEGRKIGALLGGKSLAAIKLLARLFFCRFCRIALGTLTLAWAPSEKT